MPAEGSHNDLTDVSTTLVADSTYTYTRRLVANDDMTGAEAELITISGMDIAGNLTTNASPTAHGNTHVYTDAQAPTLSAVSIQSDNTTNTAYATIRQYNYIVVYRFGTFSGLNL